MPETAAEQRIDALLAQLTLEEKISLAAGSDAWHTTPVPRVGIPRIKVTDGPNGARGSNFIGTTSACFPCGTALGATWDPELVRLIGAAIGREARSKQARVLLAPTMNIHRHPLAGRNFECPSEDPFLSARIVVGYIEGVQSQDVGATAKHFVCNDSEFERTTISSEVSERALREIYLPPFEAAVKEAGVWAVMSAYNRINGTHACNNVDLLTTILKEEWGFDGLVMSDWWGTRSTIRAANAGLDLEMPGPGHHFGNRLNEAVASGQVSEAVVDGMARRLLRLLLRTGAFDDPAEPGPEAANDLPEDRALIRHAAAEAMVLLRNERAILPLDATRPRLIAVIGPNASELSIQGGGSAHVEPHHSRSVIEAIRDRVGAGVEVRYEPGCNIHRRTPVLERGLRGGATVEYFDNSELEGSPVLRQSAPRMELRWLGDPAPGLAGDRFSVRVSATFEAEVGGQHHLTLISAGLSRLLVDGTVVLDNWTAQTPGKSFYGGGSEEISTGLMFAPGEPHSVVLEYASMIPLGIRGAVVGCEPPAEPDLMDRAVALAAAADAVIVVAGSNAEWETEGIDRVSMNLPGQQDELIARVAAANPETVVVINAGSPTAMPWVDNVAAILQAWYPGQEGGDALADVLFGDREPGGRLPTTFPVQVEDAPSHLTYPGERGKVAYAEDVFVGYRGYERRHLAPLFPFGFGLSYTAFEYGAIALDRAVTSPGEDVTVSVTIRNTGTREGHEVVQVYVHDVESTLLRPEKELKGFARVSLLQGEERTISITLPTRAFAAWDPDRHEWVTEPGEFHVLVGASSADIRGRATLRIE